MLRRRGLDERRRGGSPADGRPAGRRRPADRVLAAGLPALLCAAGVLTGGCSLLSDAANSATAPLSALPATDVAVETNLETDLTLLDTGAGGALGALGASGLGGLGGGGGGGGGGAPAGFTAGPSTGPSVTSYSSPRSGVTVIVAWNNLTEDCLGIAKLGSGSGAVLGESSPGTYDFWAPKVPSRSCVAADFALAVAAPRGWPANDPSASGFPAP